ncbi:MAG: hypothetical protein AB1585_06115 [Thermodesulfobacteriota bacterium]
MAPYALKNGFKMMGKGCFLVVLLLVIPFLLSCNQGTNSSSSAGGGSGTGTEFRTTITTGQSKIPLYATTGVTAVVRDVTGAPVPHGTMVCFTAVLNCFPLEDKCYATICETTTNNSGWSSRTYAALYYTGVDTIEVYAPSIEGTINSTKIIVE